MGETAGHFPDFDIKTFIFRYRSRDLVAATGLFLDYSNRGPIRSGEQLHQEGEFALFSLVAAPALFSKRKGLERHSAAAGR